MTAQNGFKDLLVAAAPDKVGDWQTWPGGAGAFFATGTFGGATVKLQFSKLDGNAAVPIDAGAETTLTAAGGGLFYLPACYIRGVVVGGAATVVEASAGRVQ